MGRRASGILVTIEAMRLELKFLLQNGYICENAITRAELVWTTGNRIVIQSYCMGAESEIRLIYTITNRRTGQAKEYDYTIKLVKIPSNLGRGAYFMFCCPVTGERCRILYMCNGSDIFKSYKAYKPRICYPYQICSKFDYSNTRFWQIEKDLEKLNGCRNSYFYKGKKTKRRIRGDRLSSKRIRFDDDRWNKLYIRFQDVIQPKIRGKS